MSRGRRCRRRGESRGVFVEVVVGVNGVDVVVEDVVVGILLVWWQSLRCCVCVCSKSAKFLEDFW